MTKSITPNQIKEKNRSLIYQYIYESKKVSQMDISYALHLSRPTVTANLAALEEEGLITKEGRMDTGSVGRKAAAYTIVKDFRIGIGVELLGKEVKIILVDLYGQKIERFVYDLPYREEEDYFRQVCEKIMEAKDALHIRDEQILGAGFAIQGLVSPDSETVVYGKILGCTGLSIEAFARYLPYPCSFIHDADSAAIAELWASPELTDAFYLSISTHLGAALIKDRELIRGDHGHSSTIEHIEMEPEGRLCYCGKRGCMETLCSISALLEPEEDLDAFFENVRCGHPQTSIRWLTFLRNLARSVNLLHLIYDKTFILGGYLAPYLKEQDLVFLYEELQKITPFPEASDFLQISKMPKYNITIGAALPYIQGFLERIN